jgi:uncharacterized protein
VRAAFEARQAGTGAITSLFASDMVWRIEGRSANDGRPYDNTYAWVMSMRDGQVIDGTAFYGSIAFNNDLWARMTPE